MSENRALIVAETLRFLAGWLVTDDEEHEQGKYLLETALDIEHAVAGGYIGEPTCPLCQEMRCDEGCPLAPLQK